MRQGFGTRGSSARAGCKKVVPVVFGVASYKRQSAVAGGVTSSSKGCNASIASPGVGSLSGGPVPTVEQSLALKNADNRGRELELSLLQAKAGTHGGSGGHGKSGLGAHKAHLALEKRARKGKKEAENERKRKASEFQEKLIEAADERRKEKRQRHEDTLAADRRRKDEAEQAKRERNTRAQHMFETDLQGLLVEFGELVLTTGSAETPTGESPRGRLERLTATFVAERRNRVQIAPYFAPPKPKEPPGPEREGNDGDNIQK